MFFVSWLLWEQMTFVLGMAILLVFCVGYVKLLWTNRVVKKQEVVDEEKRMRIQELRSSGQIVESRKIHDVPFGVRAIQSGIQVDGIWISQANTPTASELRLGLVGTSTDTLATPDSKSGIFSDIQPLSKQTTKVQSLSELDILPTSDRAGAAREAPDRLQTRGSYRPQKASHLRYGSRGESDQTTLQQLEGSSTQRKMHVHRPRHSGSRHAEAEGESSAADNELSSGVSTHSDTSFSQNMHTALEIQDEQMLNFQNVAAKGAAQSRVPIRSSTAEYFSIPVDSPRVEISNPFQTPLPSPDAQGYPLASYDNSQDLSRHNPQSQSSFVPGELHLNKSVRKVNSGFEVLPAGTFGVPVELKGKGLELDFEGESGERRQSAKLQKKPRTSMTGRRTSATVEHL